jgi:predicted dehydrogenase
MVDHTFVFSGAVRKIHELVAAGDLGQIRYYDSVRINLGLFQRDVNVIWDLAVHDLAILDYVFPGRPYAVSATGISHIPGRPENIAYVTLFFENDVIAHIHTNWLAPVKVRRTLIGGSRKMVLYDDVEPSEKVKIYDSGITFGNDHDSLYQLMIGYRTGDMVAPRIATTEALRQVVEHFTDSILHATTPITDGETGKRVVHLLEAATRSMSLQGRPVELSRVELAA